MLYYIHYPIKITLKIIVPLGINNKKDMKTSKVSRYFLVLLCALGCNASWGQNTMKIYFNEYNDKAAGPTLSCVGKPDGVEVAQSGFTWALSYKYIFTDNSCTDRIVVEKPSDSPNTASISFTGFKYEVKQVMWNRMCDLLSGWFQHPDVETTINSLGGQKESGTYTTKNTSFKKANFPGTNDELNFQGLSSLEIKDNFTSNYCRVFLKAGTGNSYAFQITYYEPSVDLSSVPDQIEWTENKTYVINEEDIISHPGAFDFATTYKSSDPNIFTVDANGVITPITTGQAKLTVTIKDGDVSAIKSKVIDVVAPNLGNNKYAVALKYNDGTTKGEMITATLNNAMPAVTPPTRKGYTFRGYFDNESYSQTSDNNSTKYYNADGTSARKWDKNYNSTLYAHWTAKTYTINFDACGGKLSDKVGIRTEGQDRYIETSNNQAFVSFEVQYGSEIADRFWCSDKITIKPGYKFLGWFTKKKGGTKVYSVDDKECSFNAIEGKYWTGNGTDGKWKSDLTSGTLNLYAQYECKFEIVDNGERINFKKGYINDNNEFTLFDITSYDIIAAIEEDIEKYGVSPMIVDVTNYQDYILAGKGLVGFLGNKGYNLNEYDNLEAFNTVIEEARLDNKLAPNALVYLSGSKSMYTGATNVVMTNEKQCQNLEVTDRAPIKIPYAFKADNALYERNKGYSGEDAAKAQAANSEWGTLCLPYPIRNNANNVKFYQLAGFEKNIMHYTPMNVDVIPANTPVLYKRLQGVGSEVTIKEADVDVPVNTSYSTTPGSTLDSWQFIGTLNTKIFCGKDYDKKKMPEGAIKMDGSQEIYYFKQDQFTHLADKGKVTMLPYRAYFTTTEANAKYASFSIVAIDEEGATDITNLIDNDADGDGKIYDLNGRRVMQPVSGRLYIVNGKKKVY